MPQDLLTRVFEQLAIRTDAALSLRFLLQPAMAVALGARAGFVQRGIWDIGRLFVIALLMDLLYQRIELVGVHPLQALVVAVLLAVLPYVATRTLVGLIVRRRPSARSHVKHVD